MENFKDTELFLFDLDGTVYVGDKPIDGALDTIERIKAAGKKVCYLTNNSSKPRSLYMSNLKKMGIDLHDGELYTSSQATAEYLLREQKGKKVYLLATDAVKADFVSYGIDVVEDGAEVAVLAFDTTATYDKLNKFCRYIFGGAVFVATHGDKNCPYPISPMPDVGSFIALVTAVTGRTPDAICGKPYQACADGIFLKFGGIDPKNIAMVGDRLYTDIRFGNSFGMRSVLVLTGDTTREMLKNAEDRPAVVLESIKHIVF
ncbi:MAG: HAD-IIA family hydrolase [Clostridiales bacterium]|jgi:HAD superfamily hydrolase (TIGR01450 family)|nr:HAD-IIA family hydrolase [Clostridiales bacterium]